MYRQASHLLIVALLLTVPNLARAQAATEEDLARREQELYLREEQILRQLHSKPQLPNTKPGGRVLKETPRSPATEPRASLDLRKFREANGKAALATHKTPTTSPNGDTAATAIIERRLIESQENVQKLKDEIAAKDRDMDALRNAQLRLVEGSKAQGKEGLARLETRVKDLEGKMREQDARLAEAGKQKEKLEQELKLAQKRGQENVEQLKQEIAGKDREIEALRTANSRMAEVNKSQNRNEVTGLETQVKDLEGKMREQDVRLQEAGKQKEKLEQDLSVAQTRSRELLLRLDERERGIRTLERQVDKLFSLLDLQKRVSERPRPENASLEQRARLLNEAESMPLAVVDVDNADLWTGPREEDKLLMSYPRGTQLRVELRMGNWYRVVTPAGTRAWVQAQQVVFGTADDSGPAGTIRVKGYDSRIDGPGH